MRKPIWILFLTLAGLAFIYAFRQGRGLLKESELEPRPSSMTASPQRPPMGSLQGAGEQQSISSGTRLEPREASVSATDPAPDESAALVLAATWSGGGSASHIMFRVKCHSSSRIFSTRTGSDGIATLKLLPPGRATVYSDRGDEALVLLAPNTPARLEFTIPKGHEIIGLVTDDNDRAVAGATIVISYDAYAGMSWEYATSDDQGEFLVPSAPSRRCYVSARHESFAPSPQHPLPRRVPGRPCRMKLQLSQGPCTILGSVRSVSNSPIEGAKVSIREKLSMADAVTRGTHSPFPPGALEAHTDVNGSYHIYGAPPTSVTLHVSCPGYSPILENLTLHPSQRIQHDITLTEGSSLAGHITLPTGDPASGIIVSVSPNNYPGAPPASATTDTNGEYTITDIPVGSVRFAASKGGDVLARKAQTVEPSEPAVWSPVVDTGISIRGVVYVDGRMNPSGWRVTASLDESTTPAPTRSATVGPDGAFEIIRLTSGPHTISLHTAELPMDSFYRVSGVYPEDSPVWLRPADASLPTCMITGVVNLGPLSPRDFGIAVTGAQTITTTLHTPESDGHFILGPYPPGRYEVLLRSSRTFEVHFRKQVKLEAGGTLDLGSIAR